MATSEDRPTEVIATEEPQHPADGNRTAVAQNGNPPERGPTEVNNQQNQEREQEEREAAERTAQRRKSRLKKVIPIVVIVVGVGVLLWWLHARQYESTDDAQVDGHISQISSRVSGYVTKVYVEDNQEVQAGQLLVEIDPRDYEVALAKAQADYADSQASAAAANYNVPITSVSTESQLASARADVSNAQATVAAAHKNLDAAKAKEIAANADNVKAQADLQRYKPLVQRDVISKQMYDAAVAAAQSAQANLQSAQDGAVAAQAGITQAESRLTQAQANLRAAGTGQRQVHVTQAKANSAQSSAAKSKAELEQAQLNLQYTKIYAPIHGIVGHRTVEVGQYVQPGQALMSLVDIDHIWITANFKETQLQGMKPGQPAEVTVDAFSHTYNSKVLDLGGASGARFSLFPPENATGNYVKVVQRIPARIMLNPGEDKNHELRPGMSVEAKVKVR